MHNLSSQEGFFASDGGLGDGYCISSNPYVSDINSHNRQLLCFNFTFSFLLFPTQDFSSFLGRTHTLNPFGQVAISH